MKASRVTATHLSVVDATRGQELVGRGYLLKANGANVSQIKCCETQAHHCFVASLGCTHQRRRPPLQHQQMKRLSASSQITAYHCTHISLTLS